MPPPPAGGLKKRVVGQRLYVGTRPSGVQFPNRNWTEKWGHSKKYWSENRKQSRNIQICGGARLENYLRSNVWG
jgi:hypothetical protein